MLTVTLGYEGTFPGYEPLPALTPLVRPEFVTSAETTHVLAARVRHAVVQPFYGWQREHEQASGDDPRVVEVGYLQIGEHSIPRADLDLVSASRRGVICFTAF